MINDRRILRRKGRRTTQGPARVLLALVAKRPSVVQDLAGWGLLR